MGEIPVPREPIESAATELLLAAGTLVRRIGAVSDPDPPGWTPLAIRVRPVLLALTAKGLEAKRERPAARRARPLLNPHALAHP